MSFLKFLILFLQIFNSPSFIFYFSPVLHYLPISVIQSLPSFFIDCLQILSSLKIFFRSQSPLPLQFCIFFNSFPFFVCTYFKFSFSSFVRSLLSSHFLFFIFNSSILHLLLLKFKFLFLDFSSPLSLSDFGMFSFISILPFLSSNFDYFFVFHFILQISSLPFAKCSFFLQILVLWIFLDFFLHIFTFFFYSFILFKIDSFLYFLSFFILSDFDFSYLCVFKK